MSFRSASWACLASVTKEAGEFGHPGVGPYLPVGVVDECPRAGGQAQHGLSDLLREDEPDRVGAGVNAEGGRGAGVGVFDPVAELLVVLRESVVGEDEDLDLLGNCDIGKVAA